MTFPKVVYVFRTDCSPAKYGERPLRKYSSTPRKIEPIGLLRLISSRVRIISYQGRLDGAQGGLAPTSLKADPLNGGSAFIF